MSKYTTLSYEKKLNLGLDLCRQLYLDNYPNMQNVPISKNKMLFEKIKFYLKGTKYEKEFLESLQK